MRCGRRLDNLHEQHSARGSGNALADGVELPNPGVVPLAWKFDVLPGEGVAKGMS